MWLRRKSRSVRGGRYSDIVDSVTVVLYCRPVGALFLPELGGASGDYRTQQRAGALTAQVSRATLPYRVRASGGVTPE